MKLLLVVLSFIVVAAQGTKKKELCSSIPLPPPLHIFTRAQGGRGSGRASGTKMSHLYINKLNKNVSVSRNLCIFSLYLQNCGVPMKSNTKAHINLITPLKLIRDYSNYALLAGMKRLCKCKKFTIFVIMTTMASKVYGFQF